MKKSLTNLCISAAALVGFQAAALADDWYFPTDQTQQTVLLLDANRNYYFTADGQTLNHNRTDGYGRHMTSSIYFYLGDYDATINNLHYSAKYTETNPACWGWDGATINGSANSSLTLTIAESASPVWISAASSGGMKITGGTTVYMNWGDKVMNKHTNSKISLADDSTLVQNTRRSEIANTSFIYTGTGTVKFTAESLTAGTAKGNVIFNSSLDTLNIKAKFDTSAFAAGSTVTFYSPSLGQTYKNTFALDGQNVNIYGADTTVGMKVTNSQSTGGQVYVESDIIRVDGSYLDADSKSDIYLKGQLAGSNLNAKGVGAKTIALTANSSLTGGAPTINDRLVSIISADASQKTLTMAQRINVASGLVLENVKLLVTNDAASTTTGGNNFMVLQMDAASQFETYGGLRLNSNSAIRGSVNVRGTGNATLNNNDSFMLAIMASSKDTNVITITSTGEIIQKFDSTVATKATTKAKNFIIGGLVAESGASIKLEEIPYVSNAKITVLGSDLFNIGLDGGGDFNTQANSTIKIGRHAGSVPSYVEQSEFIFFAPNEIGSFDFTQANHQLALTFSGSGSLVLGESDLLTGLTGDFFVDGSVLIRGNTVNKLRIYDITAADISKFVAEDDYVVQMVDNGDGSFFVNTVLVPEPAELAAVFGALALALAAWKRRKA